MHRAYVIVCACVVIFASGCGGSCGAEKAAARAAESVLQYLPADAAFTAIYYPTDGDMGTWDGVIPDDSTPSQVAAATAATLFREVGIDTNSSRYAAYGPGAFGAYVEDGILVTIFEMEDSDGFFEAFVSSLEARPNASSRNVERLDGEAGRSALFDYHGLSGAVDRVAAITIHEGIITLAIGAQEVRDQVLASSQKLEEVDESFSEDVGVARSIASLDGGRTARLAVGMETASFASFVGSKEQSARCRDAETRLLTEIPRITWLVSEDSDKLALHVRFALNEATAESLDGLFSTAFDVSEAVSATLPVAFSLGTTSLQNFVRMPNSEDFTDCANLAGMFGRLKHWFAGARTVEDGMPEGVMRMIIGVENVGVGILTSAPQLISRSVWSDEASANQAAEILAPGFVELEPVGVVAFDGVETPIRQVSATKPARFIAQSGADIWLSNHRFSEASVASLLTVRNAEVPMMLAVSPSSMRRLMTLMQRQMEVAVENILSAYPQVEVDRARASAVIELTNYFVDQLKAVELLTVTATLDDGDLVIEIR